MHAVLSSSSAIDRTIGTRLTPQSLAPKVLRALQALGYTLREELDETDPNDEPSGVWLVDQARIDELPSAEVAPDARILLITTPRRNPTRDARVFSEAMRPGRLSAIYTMIQMALETTPRRNPRIPIQLSARCLRADRRSLGAVLSLSEGGCLLRTGERLRKGAKLDVQFALPDFGLVSTAAECRYVRSGDAGLAFAQPAADIRRSIAHFITLQLAAAHDTVVGDESCGFSRN